MPLHSRERGQPGDDGGAAGAGSYGRYAGAEATRYRAGGRQGTVDRHDSEWS